MYYSSGNYEAFARPKKPAGVDGKSAYIIGTGLAALSAACYLVRDAQMPGKRTRWPAGRATAPTSPASAMSCAAGARWTTTSR